MAAGVKNAWMPVDEAHFEMCVDQQKRDADSPLVYYRRLLRFRKEHPALLDGSIEFVECSKDVLAFVRSNEEESILCVFNLGKNERQWTSGIECAATSDNWLIELGGFDRDKPASLPSLAGYLVKIRR